MRITSRVFQLLGNSFGTFRLVHALTVLPAGSQVLTAFSNIRGGLKFAVMKLTPTLEFQMRVLPAIAKGPTPPPSLIGKVATA